MVGKSFSILLVIAIVSCCFAEELPSNNLECPLVLDGVSNGIFDLDKQASTDFIAANWISPSSIEAFAYEWAIISEDQISNEIEKNTCRDSAGFVGLPNVQQWTEVALKTSVWSSGLKLEQGKKYFVLLRTTLADGTQVYSNSNGVMITGTPVKANELGSSTHKRETRSVSAVGRDTPKTFEKRAAANPLGSCPLDTANSCRKQKVRVGELLKQQYGPPVFNGRGQVQTVFRIPTTGAEALNVGRREEDALENGGPVNDDDDDDSSSSGKPGLWGVFAGVIIGTLLLAIIFAILALLLGKSGSSDKFQTESITTKVTDQVDADVGKTSEVTMGNETRAEFPDIDIRGD